MSTRASLDIDMRDVAQRPFDLSHDELTSFTLSELPDAAQVLLVVIHHLAIDGLSAVQFLNDLAAAYKSVASAGAPPPAPQHAAPVRQLPEPAQESLEYWGERMASLRPGTMLLHTGDYANGQASFAGAASTGRYQLQCPARCAGFAGLPTRATTLCCWLPTLLAISIIDQVRNRYDVDLPLLTIFENPTPQGLAAEIKVRQVDAAGVHATEDR